MSIWPSDAYTGRQPRFFFDLSDRKGTTRSFESDPDFGHMDNSFINHEDFDDLDFLFKSAQFGVRNKILDPKDFSSIHEYAREVQRKSGDDFQKIFDEDGAVAYGNIKKMLPPDGDPYFASDGRRKPDVNHSLEEVLARMQRAGANKAGAEGGSYNPALTRALLSEKFDSIEDIQANRDLIIPRGNEMNDVKGNWNSFVDDAMNEYKDRHTASNYRTAEKVLNAMAAGEDLSMFNLSPAATQTGRGLVDSLRKEAKGMPTQYFEAKPNYSMKLDEFGAAVVPKDVKPLVLEKLKRSGVPQVTYDPLIEGDRGRAMRDAGGDFTFANKSKTGGLLAAGMGRKDPSKANKRELDPYGFQKSKLTTGQYLDDTELRYNDYGRLLPREQKSWEDMLGKYTIPFFGDRTRGGGELLGIKDIDFELPVVAEGGTDFMRDLANQRERAIWASKRGRISTINNKVNEAANQLGTDEIYGVTGSMAPDASDFATFTGEALAELVGKSPITKKFAKEYDRNAKGIIDESFVGLLSPDLRNWAKNADPEARKRFIRSFDTAPNLAAGLPDPALARWGVNALDQRDIESGMFGLGASKIDIGAPQLYNFPKQGTNEYRAAQPHGTYDTQLTGDYFGTLPPIPQEILYSDAINKMLETLDKNGNIKAKANLTHGLKTQLPVEQVTQQKLDRIMEYLARKGK
jgi:hypothetical protein